MLTTQARSRVGLHRIQGARTWDHCNLRAIAHSDKYQLMKADASAQVNLCVFASALPCPALTEAVAAPVL